MNAHVSTQARFDEPNSIRTLRRARDWTMAELGEKVGTDASTINKLEKGHTSLSVRWAETLAKVFDVTIDEVVKPPAGAATRPPRMDVRPADVPLANQSAMPLDLPVMGTAAGSHARGAFQFEGGVIDYVRRPPALAGSKSAYALYIEGTSMEPEHRQGDLRFVHPDRPPRIGDSVVVQSRHNDLDGIEATIGHLIGRTATTVRIGKLNPVATVEIPRVFVVAVHKVLTVNDLFGV